MPEAERRMPDGPPVSDRQDRDAFKRLPCVSVHDLSPPRAGALQGGR